MRDYPTLHEVLAIHALSIEAYGGSEGVRDLGAIEAALFRPQSGYYADIIEEAAALMESLLINHPFVDGNKRWPLPSATSFWISMGTVWTRTQNGCTAEYSSGSTKKEGRFETIVHDLRSCVTER